MNFIILEENDSNWKKLIDLGHVNFLDHHCSKDKILVIISYSQNLPTTVHCLNTKLKHSIIISNTRKRLLIEITARIHIEDVLKVAETVKMIYDINFAKGTTYRISDKSVDDISNFFR